MQKPGSLQMRAAKSKGKTPAWFRIENAHVDEDNATDEVTPVYIYDVIGDSWWEDATPASEFIKQLSNIKTPRIELHLNSPGGDIFDGVAIYNALKAHPAKVTVIVDALAASAASFIAQAGDEVVMTKAATMMIHDGSAMAWGPASVMRDTADLLDKLSNTVAEIYSDRAGQTIEFWRNLMIEETWYNSHEAVAAGLADEIGEDTKDEDDEAAQNKWDLSIFNYAGRGHAPDPMQVRQRIANRLKEMTVGKPQNTSGQPEGTPEENDKNPASPEINPDADTTEGDAGEVAEEREEESSPGAVPNPATGEQGQVENKATVNMEAGTVKFTANGQVHEMSIAQAATQLAVLTEFRNESLTQARKDFVTQLAVDNKILAPQIEKMTAYALSLSDDGFDAWKDTWDGVPGHTMLENKTSGTTNHSQPQSEVREESAAQVEIDREIVQHHKRSGMSEESIKKTDSYNRLIVADPTFKL
jgi:ATP-dependent protease ClpP protease subunit